MHPTNGPFTLPETNTENKYTEPNEYISVSVSGSVNTP